MTDLKQFIQFKLMNRGNEKSPFRKTATSPFRAGKENGASSTASSEIKIFKPTSSKAEMTPVKIAQLAQSTFELKTEPLLLGEDINLDTAQSTKTAAVYTEQSGQKDNVKVVIRVRPSNERERLSGSQKHCLVVENDSKIMLDRGLDQKMFTFDYVADDQATQEEVFSRIAKPIADSCLEGYNGTIFAYGQTGSGKTFTIQGPMITINNEEQLISAANSSGATYEMRGIMQRSFEHIFARIDTEKAEAENNGCEVKYLIKSSYLEIYNEMIMDLLDPSSQNLHIREDIKTGVYVDGLIEEPISTVQDMFNLITRGARNRHVGSTQMNKESSRSHSVLTTVIESKTMTASGVWQMKSSQFHVIDLAGSERSKHTHAEGQRLKEAGMINKSLSALGIVINSLVDISEGKTRHVHYRDSKLTFLLRDSLGGNSKTLMIANITPSVVSVNETISTLKFAQRAKLIKNKAVINEESSGTIALLKSEIRRLKQQMAEQSSQQRVIVPQKLIDQNVCVLCKAENNVGNTNEFLDEMLVGGGSAQKNYKRNLSIASSADHKKIQERVNQLENLLVANLDSLTSAQKINELDQEKKQQSLMRMQAALDTLEKQSSRDKMIIKFRDQRIQKMEESLAHSGEGCSKCDLVALENAALKRERDEWKESFEKQSHAQAAKLFAEKDVLERKLVAIQLEQKQSPESFTAQVRSLNELTDSLSRYLKEHCDRSAGIVGSEEQEKLKTELQEQVLQLSDQVEALELKSSQTIQELKCQHEQQHSQYMFKLETLKTEHAFECEILKSTAREQLEEIKMQIETNVNHTEAEYHQFKINAIEAQNDLTGKLVLAQEQCREGERRYEDLKEQIKLSGQTVDELNQKLQILEEEFKAKQREMALMMDKERDQFAICKTNSESEIGYLSKQMLWEKSENEALVEQRGVLETKIFELEQSNDGLQKQLLMGSEAAQELSAQVREIESKLQNTMRENIIKLQQAQQAEYYHQGLKEEAEIRYQIDWKQMQQQHDAQILGLTSQLESAQSQYNQQVELLGAQIAELEAKVQQQEVRLEQSAKEKQSIEADSMLGRDAMQGMLAQQKEKLENQVRAHNLLIGVHDQLRQEYARDVSEAQAALHNQQVRSEEERGRQQAEIEKLNDEVAEHKSQVQGSIEQMKRVEQSLNLKCAQFEQQIHESKESHYQQLQQMQDSLHAEKQRSSIQLGDIQLEKQKLMNEVKSSELANMQLQQQVLKLQQELEGSRHTLTQKLQQVEETVKRSLESEKKATKEALSQHFQEQLGRQDSETRKHLQVSFEQQLYIQIEQKEIQMQQAFQRHQRNLLSRIAHIVQAFKQLKQQHQVLKSEMAKRSWLSIAPSFQHWQAMLQTLPNPAVGLTEELKQLKISHSKAIQAQLAKESQLKEEVSAQQEELSEYKGLTYQLQDEKQEMISQIRALQKQIQDQRIAIANKDSQQTEQIQIINSKAQNSLQERTFECDAMRQELDSVRNKHVDVSTELAKHKSKVSDLTASLKAAKETIAVLMNEKNNLMAEVKKRIEEIGSIQNQWQQKVGEQKRELNELRAERDLLRTQQAQLGEQTNQLMRLKDQEIQSKATGIQTWMQERDQLRGEVNQYKLIASKRESELKEVVRTLKKFSDEKKSLEAEVERLRKESELDVGHNNVAQKIQHHLKIKEENNKLREDNYLLKEEVRRKCEVIAMPQPKQASQETELLQKANRDCAQVCDVVDKLVDFIVQQPTVANFLSQNKRLHECLRKSPASTSTHAASMAQQKAKVAFEVITHINKTMQQLIKQQNDLKMLMPQGDQSTRSQKLLSPPKAVVNLNEMRAMQNSQKPPQSSNPYAMENSQSKVNQAATFLNQYQDRSKSSNAVVRQ